MFPDEKNLTTLSPVLLLIILVVCSGCSNNDTAPALFESLPASVTGIDFINTLEERPGNNIPRQSRKAT